MVAGRGGQQWCRMVMKDGTFRGYVGDEGADRGGGGEGEGLVEWEWCGGLPLSYFQGEYFESTELFPARPVLFYDFIVKVRRERGEGGRERCLKPCWVCTL